MSKQQAQALTFVQEFRGEVQLASVDSTVLTQGAWATILFEVVNGEAEHAGYVLARYQKKDGDYVLRSKFKLSPSTATKAVEALVEMMPEFATEEGAADAN